MRTRMRLPSSQVYTEEAVLMRKVKEWLEPQERDGIKMLRICDRYAKGYSDLFICVNGQFVIAELKDDIGKPSKHQEQFIEEMIAAGAIGGVCRSVKDVADLVEQAKERSYVRKSKYADKETLRPGLQSAT